MAIAQGSAVTAADVRAVMTNVANAYRKTTGRTVSWNPAVSQGSLLSYTTLSQINSYGTSANASYRTTGCTSNYANNSNQTTSCGRCAHFTHTNYFTNNKCGGESTLWLGHL